MNRLVMSAVLSGLFLLSGCPGDPQPAPAPTHGISGTVARAWGGALQGVTVTLRGDASRNAVTDASGGYAFTGLADGSYTVTPALAGYAFTPAAPSVALAGADRTQDFTADGAYAISGTVSGSAVGGVSIALSGGGVVKPAAVSAAGTGAYAFSGIPNGTYTLTPSLAGHAFVPAQASVVVGGAAATQDFTATTARSIAGTVRDLTGAPMAGMTLRLTGAASAIATTDETGGYSFSGLAGGASYTVTPATFAYDATPAERAYTTATDVTAADFVASISTGQEPRTYAGTLSYSGSKTGPVYVTVTGPYGGGNPSGGTGLATQQGPWSDRPFTVRNAQAGTWITVRAWMDTLGTGRFNAGADPSVYFNGSPPGSPIDVGNLVLTDPPVPTVTSPVGVKAVIPLDGTAVVIVDLPRNADGAQVADSFRVSWNDSATVDSAHSLGTVDVPAGADFAILRGLTNGRSYWFRVDAYLGGALLAGQTATTTTGVAPGPSAGSASVTGTVTHPAVASPSALYLVGQPGKGGDPGAGGIFVQRIANPAGTETPYALSLPPGTYQVFAFIDVGDDGAVTVGEPAAFPSSDSAPVSTFVAGANTGPTVAIPGGNAFASLHTSRWAMASSSWTNLVAGVASGAKRPLAAFVTGPGLRGEVDFGMSDSGGSAFDLGSSFQTSPVLPFAGDTYTIHVTYTDGTTDTLRRDVTGVFGSTPVAVAPANGATGVPTVPTFTWSAPTGAPGAYSYTLQVWPESGDSVWETFLPSAQTSVAYDADGTAGAAQLSGSTAHGWVIRATDENGNDASYQAGFTTGAAQLPLLDALDGTTLDGLLWQTPQLTRSISGGKAVLGVHADDMQAFTIQGAQYVNSIAVPQGAGRVTTFRATVSVPAGLIQRTGTGVAATGMRLLYQPSANRGFPFPTGNLNVLTAALELYDSGSGLQLRRRFLHCDVASCATYAGTGITTTDPAGFTASADGVDASAPAAYDTPYTFELTVNESTGVITWSVQGGDFATAKTGTGDVSTWIAGKGMTLATGFTFGQLYSRAIDLAGGSSAGVAGAFDDVYVGFGGSAATPWDDFGSFSTTAFDPRKWGAVDSDVWLSGGLHLASAVTTAVAGALGESTFVNLMYPASLRAWQADVAFAVDEPAPATGSSTSFSMVGAFFNDGTAGGGANDATGDVRARVSLSSVGSTYGITRCANALCSMGTTSLSSGPLFPTRPLTPGTVHTVLVQWNPGSRSFTFVVDEAPPVLVNVAGTVGSPTPNYPLHQLSTTAWIAATATAGASSRVEAVVTNVRGERN